jgi:hypothetical protein
MDRPGKLKYKQLTDIDIPAIEDFCEQCRKLGWQNNSSLAAMKFDKATFFAGFDEDKIVSLAGCHRLPEVNENAWRCLFRGAQLPGYTPEWSRNILKSAIGVSQLLYMQIKYIQEIENNYEIFISTNINSDTGGKSSRMNNVIMPMVAKQGYWDLYLENFMLNNVLQNIWKVNVPCYMSAREEWLSSILLK